MTKGSRQADAAVLQASCRHVVGDIRGENVSAEEWNAKYHAFQLLVEDFNERGIRQEIPHPGWAIPFRFCPSCGISLKFEAMGLRRE